MGLPGMEHDTGRPASGASVAPASAPWFGARRRITNPCRSSESGPDPSVESIPFVRATT